MKHKPFAKGSLSDGLRPAAIVTSLTDELRGRLIHSPSLVAAELLVGYGTWADILLFWLVGLNIGWDLHSLDGLWLHVIGENFHWFPKVTDSSLAQSKYLPLGLCEWTVEQSHEEEKPLTWFRDFRESIDLPIYYIGTSLICADKSTSAKRLQMSCLQICILLPITSTKLLNQFMQIEFI